jgi:hypothetical protein
LSLRNDRSQRSTSTHTTTQYFYAEVNPLLERVLGSTNMHASTKVFVDGDYIGLHGIFPYIPSSVMPQQTRFRSYNIINDEQRHRLGAVTAPIATQIPDDVAVLNTYSLYQDVNTQRTTAIASRLSPPPNLPRQNTEWFNHEPVAGEKRIPTKTLFKDLRSVAAVDVFPMTCPLSRSLTS